MSGKFYEYFFAKELAKENIIQKRVSSIIPRKKEILSLLNLMDQLNKSAVFADVGCGSAFYSYLLAKESFALGKRHIFIAVDPNPELMFSAAKYYNMTELSPKIFKHPEYNLYLAVGDSEKFRLIASKIGIQTPNPSEKIQKITRELLEARDKYVKAYKQLAGDEKIQSLFLSMKEHLKKKGFQEKQEVLNRFLLNTAISRVSEKYLLQDIYRKIIRTLNIYEEELFFYFKNNSSNIDVVFCSWLPFEQDFIFDLINLGPKILVQVKESSSTGVLPTMYFPAKDYLLPDEYFIAQNIFYPSYMDSISAKGYKKITVWPGVGFKKYPIEYLFYALAGEQKEISLIDNHQKYRWEKYL